MKKFFLLAHSQQKSKVESKVKFDKLAKYGGEEPITWRLYNTETKKSTFFWDQDIYRPCNYGHKGQRTQKYTCKNSYCIYPLMHVYKDLLVSILRNIHPKFSTIVPVWCVLDMKTRQLFRSFHPNSKAKKGITVLKIHIRWHARKNYTTGRENRWVFAKAWVWNKATRAGYNSPAGGNFHGHGIVLHFDWGG